MGGEEAGILGGWGAGDLPVGRSEPSAVRRSWPPHLWRLSQGVWATPSLLRGHAAVGPALSSPPCGCPDPGEPTALHIVPESLRLKHTKKKACGTAHDSHSTHHSHDTSWIPTPVSNHRPLASCPSGHSRPVPTSGPLHLPFPLPRMLCPHQFVLRPPAHNMGCQEDLLNLHTVLRAGFVPAGLRTTTWEAAEVGLKGRAPASESCRLQGPLQADRSCHQKPGAPARATHCPP